MAWIIILVAGVEEWFFGLDKRTANLVAAAIDELEAVGPALGRPLVDSIKDSTIHNLKELRPGSQGRSEVRILFTFDPDRQAILLVAGDKSGQWDEWYQVNIPIAERRYAMWLSGQYSEERDAE